MFVGAVPKPVVGQILRVCRFAEWGQVWVGCSGSFRVDLAIARAHPGVAVRSNDVSLLSGALAALLMGEELEFRFRGELAFAEEAVADLDYPARVAALLVVTEMAQFSSRKLFATRIFAHYRDNFRLFLDRSRGKVQEFAAVGTIASYHPGDFRQQAARAAEHGGGVAAFPPTYKAGYEKIFQFITDNTEWAAPGYAIWDPKMLPGWIDEVEASGIPFCILTDHPIEGRDPVTVFYGGANKPVYTFAGHANRVSVSRGGESGKAVRFVAADPWQITRQSRIELAQLDAGQASYLKRIFLAQGIRFATSTVVDLAVLVDGHLAGLIAYGMGHAHDFHERYLMCDFSVSRERRLSKLIALLATCRPVVDQMDHRILTRTTVLSTTVFTDKPISMKYRGIMDLRTRHKDGRLIYAVKVRDWTVQEALEQWLKRHAGGGRGGSGAGQARDPHPARQVA
jgi:hypothetical protein